jgi:hypothetical protein
MNYLLQTRQSNYVMQKYFTKASVKNMFMKTLLKISTWAKQLYI